MPEEVGYCMLPYVRDQILEVVNESLLVAVLKHTEADLSLIPAWSLSKLNRIAENTSFMGLIGSGM